MREVEIVNREVMRERERERKPKVRFPRNDYRRKMTNRMQVNILWATHRAKVNTLRLDC